MNGLLEPGEPQISHVVAEVVFLALWIAILGGVAYAVAVVIARLVRAHLG